MRHAAVERVALGVPPASRPVRPAGGEPPPPRPAARPVPTGMLAMAIFLATEAMLFAGLISAFLILRAGAPLWPPPGQPRLPIEVTGLNSAVLLFSAYTIHRAVGESRSRRRAGALGWLVATAALGTTFLLVQGAEWIALIRHGLRASSSLYAASFYTVIGCHGLHVLAAVITLIVVLGWTVRWQTTPGGDVRLEVCRLYWLFVVAVWPVLYVLVYLT